MYAMTTPVDVSVPTLNAWFITAVVSLVLNLLVFIWATPSYPIVFALVNYLDFALAGVFGWWAAKRWNFSARPAQYGRFIGFVLRGPVGWITLGHCAGLVFGMGEVAPGWVGNSVTVISTTHTLLAGLAAASVAMLLELPGKPRFYPRTALGLIIGGGSLYSAYTAYAIQQLMFSSPANPVPADTMIKAELFAIQMSLAGYGPAIVGLSINACTVVAAIATCVWARNLVMRNKAVAS